MKYALTLLFALATPVVAQEAPAKPPQCLPRQTVTDKMVRQGASPILLAPMGEYLYEIWSNGERWSAFVTKRNPDISCPVAGGEGEPLLADPICVDPVRCPRV